MEQHYIWLFNKSDRLGLWWPFFASLLLHAFMFAIMATTTIFFPPAGNRSNLDIVWIYPSLLFGGETETPPPPQSTPPEEKTSPATSAIETATTKPLLQEQEPIKETAETRSVHQRLPPPSPLPSREAVEPPPLTEPLSPEPEAEPDSEPEMSIPAGAPQPPAIEAKRESPEKVVAKEIPPPAGKGQPAPKVAVAIEQPPVNKIDSTTAKANSPASAPETKLPPAVEPPTSSRKTSLPSEKPQAPIQQATAKKAAPTPPQAPPAAPPKAVVAAPSVASPALPSPGITGRERKVTVEKRTELSSSSKPVNGEKPAEKLTPHPAGPTGIFTLPLSGDLKIEITGPDEALKAVRISVIFREYTKTRHNRPMTKANFRNSRVLTPKMARVAKNTLQVVIEIAEEGIYDFKDLSTAAGPASFTVKIYENSARAKKKSAGTRMVGAKGSIAKVLMPEGILWDDDSAFSGSMEDSESITRFNTDSGLVWKEYKEE